MLLQSALEALGLLVLVALGLIRFSPLLRQPVAAVATKRKMTQQRLPAAALVAAGRVARLTAAIPVEQAIRRVFLRLKEIAVALVITRLACILSLAAVAAHQQPEPMDRKTLRPVFQEMAEPELPRLFLAHQ
jgi:hypothetical protein